MPEILEAEIYRIAVDETVGRRIESFQIGDAAYVRDPGPDALVEQFVGSAVRATARHGKLVIVETTAGDIGLRFGMTGKVRVDGLAPIDALEYAPSTWNDDWNRFAVDFDTGSLVINDVRRLGSVEAEPDRDSLGPDAWGIGPTELAALCGRGRGAIKSLLLNQKKIAGLGNLLVDELLWRTSVAPHRPAGELTAHETRRIGEQIVPLLDELFAAGGSHCGAHVPERHVDGRCPVDNQALVHATVGGRSTWWCREHQS